MSGKSPKRKGDGYERELAKYFNEKVFDGDDKVQRAPLSGGGAVRSSGEAILKIRHIYMWKQKEQRSFRYINL